MSRFSPCAAAFLISVLAVWAAGQTTRESRPSPKDPLDAVGLPPVLEGTRVAKAPVVTIDGNKLETDDLAREIAEIHGPPTVELLVRRTIVEHELAKRKIKLDSEEVEREAIHLLSAIDPRMPWSDAVMNPGIASDLREQARELVAWKHVRGEPAHEYDPESARMMVQLELKKLLEFWKIKKRDAGDALPAGMAAELTDADGKPHDIPDKQVLEKLRGSARADDLATAREGLVDDWLLGRKLVGIGQAVTPGEIAKVVSEVSSKYKPPFDWKMICQFKGSTVAKETAMFRRLLAWKKITGFAAKPEDVAAFTKERADYFRGENRVVKQILFKTADLFTGAALDSGTQEQAAAEAREAYAALKKGADFGEMAADKSDDPQTASKGGDNPKPFKRHDPSVEPALRDVVAGLTDENPLSQPVKGAKGWYIFKLQKVNPGNAKVDLANKNFADWITEEFERMHYAKFVAALRAEAKIAMGSDSAIAGW